MNKETDCFAQNRSVTIIRRQDKFLMAVNAQVLQDVVFRLDDACSRFLRGLSRRPRFKRIDRYKSFTYPQLGGFRVLNGRLRLSRIGLIKAKLSRSIQGVQKTCTIIKDIDRWYACIATLSKTPQNVCQKPGRPAVGVDLGISRLATLSDGMTFENPKTAGSSVKRIKTLQRRLSRRNKGSRNWNKTRTLLGKAWRKVRNQRLDSTTRFPRIWQANTRRLYSRIFLF